MPKEAARKNEAGRRYGGRQQAVGGPRPWASSSKLVVEASWTSTTSTPVVGKNVRSGPVVKKKVRSGPVVDFDFGNRLPVRTGCQKFLVRSGPVAGIYK